MTTLVVDHLDSFTFNLVQQIGALGGDPIVVRSDRLTMDAVHRIAPSRIVLSPGPGDPSDMARAGIAMDLLTTDIPILGVCFGHQLIVRAFGGSVVRTTPRHGKVSLIEHTGAGIFRDLPRPFPAMRYHSLAADRASLPADLEITAWCKDGTVMAVSHRSRPVIGVQFHPESIGTPAGSALVGAFLAIRGTDVLLSESA